MPEYLIKREKCECLPPRFIPKIERPRWRAGIRVCPKCEGAGYIDTLVPFSEAFAEAMAQLSVAVGDAMQCGKPVVEGEQRTTCSEHNWQSFTGGPIEGMAVMCIECGALGTDADVATK